jgi:hypothetical protein
MTGPGGGVFYDSHGDANTGNVNTGERTQGNIPVIIHVIHVAVR